jgi:hypothetical protein
MIIKDEYIYRGEKLKINFKYLNEFIGISLPKLYILLLSSGIEMMEISEILEKSINLYEKIQTLFENNRNEKIFLENDHEDDIEIIKEVYNEIGVSFPILDRNDDESFDSPIVSIK